MGKTWRKTTNTVLAPTRGQQAAYNRNQRGGTTSKVATYTITDLQQIDPTSDLLTRKDLHYQRNRTNPNPFDPEIVE